MHSDGPSATAAVAADLAGRLQAGDLVLLHGDVGAGKTTFVRAYARAVGIYEPITSPTYTLAHRYAARPDLLHIDAYRLEHADDEELGLLLDGAEDAVTFIEWPGALDGAALTPRMVVRITHEGGDARTITITEPVGPAAVTP